MDGIRREENVVRIFTTNEPVGEIDPAFTRPGRIDVRITIGLPTPDLRRTLVKRWPALVRDGFDVDGGRPSDGGALRGRPGRAPHDAGDEPHFRRHALRPGPGPRDPPPQGVRPGSGSRGGPPALPRRPIPEGGWRHTGLPGIVYLLGTLRVGPPLGDRRPIGRGRERGGRRGRWTSPDAAEEAAGERSVHAVPLGEASGEPSDEDLLLEALGDGRGFGLGGLPPVLRAEAVAGARRFPRHGEGDGLPGRRGLRVLVLALSPLAGQAGGRDARRGPRPGPGPRRLPARHGAQRGARLVARRRGLGEARGAEPGDLGSPRPPSPPCGGSRRRSGRRGPPGPPACRARRAPSVCAFSPRSAWTSWMRSARPRRCDAEERSFLRARGRHRAPDAGRRGAVAQGGGGGARLLPRRRRVRWSLAACALSRSHVLGCAECRLDWLVPE